MRRVAGAGGWRGMTRAVAAFVPEQSPGSGVPRGWWGGTSAPRGTAGGIWGWMGRRVDSLGGGGTTPTQGAGGSRSGTSSVRLPPYALEIQQLEVIV